MSDAKAIAVSTASVDAPLSAEAAAVARLTGITRRIPGMLRVGLAVAFAQVNRRAG